MTIVEADRLGREVMVVVSADLGDDYSRGDSGGICMPPSMRVTTCCMACCTIA